ncbi:MAG TPA: aminopeptidase, partial [Candidatus Hodarchaeales archaeon]|nr:aminopeptidase [Candidatus Hodarchaeales archaeon]
FGRDFAIEAMKVGKRTFVQLFDDRLYEALVEDITPNGIQLSKMETESLKSADLIVWLPTYQNSQPRISLEALKAVNSFEATQERLARERNILWLAYPSGLDCERAGKTLESCEIMLARAIGASPQKMKVTGEAIIKMMGKSDTLRILTGNMFELLVETGGRVPGLEDGYFREQDGELYLPAGEVYIAPPEKKVDGEIVFDHPLWNIKELWLEFSNGRIVDYSADSGEDLIKQWIESSTGNPDVIAEIGFGINPECLPIGWFLYDEKALGTIHLAIGENRHLGGVNESSLHKDFMSKSATVFLGEKEVILDGILKSASRS